jgi:hypothetical protein
MDVNSFSTPNGRFAEPVIKADESNFFVRATIVNIAAPPTRVTIRMPSGRDLIALKRLENHRNCVGLLSEFAMYRKAATKDSECRALASEFNDTMYGAYARLGMALADIADIEKALPAF